MFAITPITCTSADADRYAGCNQGCSSAGVRDCDATDTTASNLKALRDFKAANDEILKKQKTALETLDELQKAADQIKMYTKRT